MVKEHSRSELSDVLVVEEEWGREGCEAPRIMICKNIKNVVILGVCMSQSKAMGMIDSNRGSTPMN